MPKVLPSQIIGAIDGMFGASRSEVDGGAITYVHRAEVHALLGLLDQVPSELVDLPTTEYLEYSLCRAVLATSLALWNVGDTRLARDVGGEDAVERIRRLMKQCHDELPPPERELPFIADTDVRLGIEDRIRAAWTDFNAREWMGATVFAGAALEALLLWALKQVTITNTPKRSLDQLHLADLISLATSNGVIDAATEQPAGLAKRRAQPRSSWPGIAFGRSLQQSNRARCSLSCDRSTQEVSAVRTFQRKLPRWSLEFGFGKRGATMRFDSVSNRMN